MSSINSRSKLNWRAAIQAIPHTVTATHGTPLESVRRKTRGAYPSCAIAKGRRESDNVSELNDPNVLIMVATSSATPNHDPASSPEILTQLPVAQLPRGTPARQTVTTGITYDSVTAATARSITRGYVRCGFSTS